MNLDTLGINKVVFVGAGNMAEALVKGMLAGRVCPACDIRVTDVSAARLSYFEKELKVAGSRDNAAAIKDADVVVLAVKPQVMAEVLEGLRGVVAKQTLFLSIAAGLPTGWIEGRLGEGVRVVRAMPNTPALVRSGAAAICGGRWASEQDLQVAEAVLGAVGVVVRVAEKDMDAVTAISGSGPAYFYYFMEALIEAARDAGLDEGVARRLICATMEGTAKMVDGTGLHPEELRRQVTSKGGTTEAAFRVLEEKTVYDAFVAAIAAAHKRAKELSGQ